ncbi:hypothetical protein [Alkalinema sp. FACHB-956]|uniref:hypothetical protein n=1 Tax=Alkalinema sp. FACHB-956 TaxID=2692768 RepID=UPI0016823872|nr:hypothetical protein [Alkalinema sp. FACHB-956]MBD2326482.1 hypothetical protein [Alkalinema sp. FACHB-956]
MVSEVPLKFGMGKTGMGKTGMGKTGMGKIITMIPFGRRSIYRQDPLMGWLLTGGAINVVLGSWADHSTLVLLGLVTVGMGLSLRWISFYLRHPRYNSPDQASPHESLTP